MQTIRPPLSPLFPLLLLLLLLLLALSARASGAPAARTAPPAASAALPGSAGAAATTTTLLRRGLALYQAGKLPEAIAIYRRVAAATPPSADAFHLLGVASFSSGDFRTAEASVRRALFLQPRNPNFHNTLGEIMRRGDPPRLEQALVI